jgi:hypothetical protein
VATEAAQKEVLHEGDFGIVVEHSSFGDDHESSFSNLQIPSSSITTTPLAAASLSSDQNLTLVSAVDLEKLRSQFKSL